MKINRQEVYDKLDGHCAYCGDPIDFKAMQVDHIIAQESFIKNIRNSFRIPDFLSHLTENDLNHIDNLHPSCRVCNKWKNCFDLDFFRSEIEEQPKRLMKRSAPFRMAGKYGLVLVPSPIPVVFYFEERLNEWSDVPLV